MARSGEARQNLSAKNGKPRDANRLAGHKFHDGEIDNATANNGTQLVRDAYGNTHSYNPKFNVTQVTMKDGTQANARKGNHLPNNTEQYIDDVLVRSGMAEGDTPASVTNPTGSSMADGVDADVNAGLANDVDINNLPPEIEKAAEDSGMSFGEVAAIIAAGGGAALILRKITSGKGYTSQTGAANPANVVDDAIDADGNPVKAGIPNDPSQTMPEGPEKQLLLGAPDQRIAGPQAQQATVGPQPTLQTTDGSDDYLNELMGDAPTNQNVAAQAAVEGRMGNGVPPSTQGRFAESNANLEQNLSGRALQMQEAVSQMSGMSPREAVQFAQQNGIEINDDIVRMLAESSNTTRSNAVRGAVSSASRSAARAAR